MLAGEEYIPIGEENLDELELEHGTSEICQRMECKKHGYPTTSTPCSETRPCLLIYQREGGLSVLTPGIFVTSLIFQHLFLLALILLAIFPIGLILLMSLFCC